jgi:hypothetical protein
MEARTSFRGTGISKLFVVVVGVIIAMGLGAMAAGISTKLSGSATTQKHLVSGPAYHQAVAGPDAADRNAQLAASRLTRAYFQVDTRGVIQSPASSLGPDALDRNSKLAAAQLAKSEKAPISSVGPDLDRNSQLAADQLAKSQKARGTRIPVGYF